MKRLIKRSIGSTMLLVAASSSGLAMAVEHPFDGRWSVVLTCADTEDRNGLVKGYEFTFTMTVLEGNLHAEYGAPGRPASVVYSGQVSDDGLLQIAATGNTGRSDYSVGKVPRGSQYNYTMQGKLGPSSGQASRREVRPCAAVFTKL